MQQGIIKFLQEPKHEQKAVFEATAEKIESVAFNVEKDFWVCFMLDMLFNNLPDSHPALLFKGGTSLSKVYGHINRFSEDIDIVIRRSDLGFENNPVTLDLSNKKRKQYVKDVIKKCSEYMTGTLRNELEKQIKNTLIPIGISDEEFSVSIDKKDAQEQTLLFKYPTLYPVAEEYNYIKRMVKIESGARSALEPQSNHCIKPYIAAVLPEMNLDITEITTISDIRTFWDKALMLHGVYYGYHDEDRLPKGDEHRISRHYYDLAVMANTKLKEKAIENIDILEEIKKHNQSVNFHSAWQKPNLATPGTFKLAPYDKLKELVLKDYKKMREMIFGDPPSSEFILDNLSELENDINKLSK